ncbi:hypothetical protein N9980_00625 [bacterium]|nr:hypothetical protein [bacterium]
MTKKTNPQKIYDILIAANGEWVDVDIICQSLLITRRIANNNIKLMRGPQKHLYPGVKKSSKRTTFNNRFGQSQPKFDIKFRVEASQDELSS